MGVLYRPNPDKLIRHPERPLCDGAMYSPGFFPGGYLCKPGNHGYDLLRALARRFGFDPENTPWNSMTTQAQEAVLYGVSQPLAVPHETRTGGSETRTVRFPGFYGWLGDWDTSGTYTDTTVCPECNGAGLRPMTPRRSAHTHAADDRVMRVTGARENNLHIDEVSIPLGRLVGVCGVSGSGKSSLVVDTLGRAVAPVRHTTSVASEPVDPGRHDAIAGAPERAVVVTQAGAGVSSAADSLGLPKALAKAFATECDCNPEDLLKRAESCNGRGVIRTDIGFLAPLTERCEQCGGSGYAPSGNGDTARGYTFPEMVSATIEEISRTWSDVERVAGATDLLCRIGLGPGGGPDGGCVIAEGTPEQIAAGSTPTAHGPPARSRPWSTTRTVATPLVEASSTS